MKKRYLGDGVYIEVERGMFKLTTEDGIRVTNTVFLEPEVYHQFHRYATEAFAFYAKKEEPQPCPKCGESMDGVQHGRSECNTVEDALEAFQGEVIDERPRIPPPVDGEFEFHCAEFAGCTENHCAYPGEEDCAMGTRQ